MYKFIPFEVEHALRLNMQPEQHINHELMGLWDEAPWDLLQAGEAWSMEVEGEVTLMFGVIPVWPGRATGWFMGDGVLASSNFEKRVRAMLEATREASKRLDSKQEDPSYRRIEAPVRWNYKQGNQWARMLGFRREGLMKAWDVDGNDHIMYARVRNV